MKWECSRRPPCARPAPVESGPAQCRRPARNFRGSILAAARTGRNTRQDCGPFTQDRSLSASFALLRVLLRTLKCFPIAVTERLRDLSSLPLVLSVARHFGKYSVDLPFFL